MSNVVVVINDQGARRIFDCLNGWQEKVCFNCSTYYVFAGEILVLMLSAGRSFLSSDRKPDGILFLAKRMAQFRQRDILQLTDPFARDT